MPRLSSPARRLVSPAQLAVPYASLATLGLGVGFRGVAWPSISATFQLPLDAVAVWLMVSTAGTIVSSFAAGPIASRIGVGRLLALSTLGAALGLVGYSLTPTWWAMVLLGLLSGLGNGAVHVGLNAHFAAHLGARALNGLHACFGLGATLGPLAMTALLRAGWSWRWAYGAAGLWLVMMAAIFALTLSRWRGSTEEARQDPHRIVDEHGALETLQLPIVWLSLLLFFAYTGVEASTGQWAYSLFTSARNVPEATAGIWMSIYWGGLAGSRLLLGPLVERIGTVRLLRLCMVCVTVGAALIWWNPVDLLSFLGLSLMGFAQGPIFPSLVSVTPRRVSVGDVDNVIGFQVASAGLGAAVLTSFAGLFARRVTLEIIGPFLVAWAAVEVVVHELTIHRARVGRANRSAR